MLTSLLQKCWHQGRKEYVANLRSNIQLWCSVSSKWFKILCRYTIQIFDVLWTLDRSWSALEVRFERPLYVVWWFFCWPPLNNRSLLMNTFRNLLDNTLISFKTAYYKLYYINHFSSFIRDLYNTSKYLFHFSFLISFSFVQCFFELDPTMKIDHVIIRIISTCVIFVYFFILLYNSVGDLIHSFGQHSI